jgi:serine O-acetyltransferase
MTSSPSWPTTLAGTCADILADVKRKRRQMGRPVNLFTVLTGFLSLNVIAVSIWRFSIWFMGKRLFLPAMALYYLNLILFGLDATPYSLVGPGFVVAHMSGCVFHGKFGKNCTVYGRAGVGGMGRGDTGGWRGGPVLGDDVTVGFGALLLTDEAVGDGAILGPGSVCFKGVPAGAMVLSPTAKIIRRAEEAAPLSAPGPI